MFTNLLSLIIVLLLLSMAVEGALHSLDITPKAAFAVGMISYCVLLLVIYFQRGFLKRLGVRGKGAQLILVNVELIAFLAFFHFVLGAHRLFNSFGLQTSVALFSLVLYFGGLAVFHYSHSTLAGAWKQLRLIIPFVIPFMLFALVLDLLTLMPGGIKISTGALFFLSLFFMGLMMIFLPFFIQWIWGCEELPDGALKESLEHICKKAHFKHAGFKTWTIMNDSFTAAVVGIVPRFRYIMFTKRLLERLSPQAIAAILAHEIGHSYRKHLLIYPLIIFGMLAVCGLFSLFFSEGLTAFLNLHHLQSLEIFLVFIPYALIIALYFRYIFGYFSRTFERQADLHGFELNVPPEHMIEALNDVAVASGHTHHQPSWHHYSIRERMDFLEKAQWNPTLIAKHHRKAWISLWIYMAALAIALGLLIAPLMPSVTPFKQLTTFSEQVSHRFNQWLNHH